MGYTHYWYRNKEIPEDIFKKIVDDFRKLLPSFKMLGIQLANGVGEGEPKINYEYVIFNGSINSGNPEADIDLPWPDDDIILLFPAPDPKKAISGKWLGGDLLKQRACGRDCSYETFYFPRIEDEGHVTGPIAYYDINGNPVYHDKRLIGKYSNSCKTSFRPYDLAVISFLTIAKHYLNDEIIVYTDGLYQHWADAFLLCQDQLGYGEEYNIKNGELIKTAGKPLVVFLRGD